jgi:hypothetical protein
VCASRPRELVSSSPGEETDRTSDEAVFAGRRRQAEIMIWHSQANDQRWSSIMLAEKFFLVLEALKRSTYQDGSPRVISTSPHVPVKLPIETAK